jgi:ABC-three component (ABC-3C) system Middle Component 2
METVAKGRRPATFNGPLEAGVRAVAVLAAAHPRSFDLQRLIAFDYLLVHTGDIGGPDSLHPPVPLQSAEMLVRRKLVEQALLMMMTRDLVRREASADGIRYRARENAAPFLEGLQSGYLKALKQRADWLVGALGARSETEFRAIMRRFFDSWVEEFQTAERSLGADS